LHVHPGELNEASSSPQYVDHVMVAQAVPSLALVAPWFYKTECSASRGRRRASLEMPMQVVSSDLLQGRNRFLFVHFIRRHTARSRGP
jgi:hypothetical protein